MSVQRSPPETNNLKTPPFIHYGSDPAINTTTSEEAGAYLNIIKRQKRTLEGYPGHSATDMSEIKAMFAEIKSQQDLKFQSINDAMSMIITQNQGIQQTVDHINCQYEEMIAKVNYLESENKEYKNRLSILERKVELLEKRARGSMVEIRNVPRQEQENRDSIVKIVQNIGQALNLETPIEKLEFRDLHRTPKGSILVDFSTIVRKEEVLFRLKKNQKAKRLNNGQPLTTSEIDLPGTPTRIYISESLTNRASHLYFLAREGVKNKKLFAAWTSYGKIFVKTNEETAPIRIEEETELLLLTK